MWNRAVNLGMGVYGRATRCTPHLPRCETVRALSERRGRAETIQVDIHPEPGYLRKIGRNLAVSRRAETDVGDSTGGLSAL